MIDEKTGQVICDDCQANTAASEDDASAKRWLVEATSEDRPNHHFCPDCKARGERP
jgi:hypothetical protein